MKNNFFPNEKVELYFSEYNDGPMNFVGHEIFDSERRANRAMFLKSINLTATDTVVPECIHGARIESVAKHNPMYGSIIADAVITDRKGLALTMNFGDCPTLALYDPINEVIALVHCGWKPLSHAIVRKTVEKMRLEYNCFSSNLHAFIGPGLCQQHFEIGPEVAAKLRVHSEGKMYFDLNDEISRQLVKEGVRGPNISHSGFCTFHTENIYGKNKYFSWRRDKSNPLQVGMASFVMKKDGIISDDIPM